MSSLSPESGHLSAWPQLRRRDYMCSLLSARPAAAPVTRNVRRERPFCATSGLSSIAHLGIGTSYRPQADCDACLMAARMRTYVPHRQILPDMAASISGSVGFGLLSIRAAADMIWPDWQ